MVVGIGVACRICSTAEPTFVPARVGAVCSLHEGTEAVVYGLAILEKMHVDGSESGRFGDCSDLDGIGQQQGRTGEQQLGRWPSGGRSRASHSGRGRKSNVKPESPYEKGEKKRRSRGREEDEKSVRRYKMRENGGVVRAGGGGGDAAGTAGTGAATSTTTTTTTNEEKSVIVQRRTMRGWKKSRRICADGSER